MTKKLYETMTLIQGIYTLLTAAWALLHIDSFMAVTGPKTDIWLVKTVAVLLIPIGLCFLLARRIDHDYWMIILLGITSCIGLAAIDFYYTSAGTIHWIYALDGILQVLFLTGWIYLARNKQKLG